MFIKFLIGGAIGAASSLAFSSSSPRGTGGGALPFSTSSSQCPLSCPAFPLTPAGGSHVVYCASGTAPNFGEPTLDFIMDPRNDMQTIRAVVIGGGYSGSKMAYQMDSMFEVTLIDEKNFYELSNDIIPIIVNKWEEEKHREACRRMLMLHRYYLKRTNVVTGTVNGVDNSTVYLSDGRKVGYDLLFVATGEQKPFPFRTTQRTITGRVRELQHFNEFLQTCRKVAVVGGGPVGTSLAYELASVRTDMEVHLFQSRSELLPTMPGMCGKAAREMIEKHPNAHVHLSTRVTDVAGVTDAGATVAPPQQQMQITDGSGDRAANKGGEGAEGSGGSGSGSSNSSGGNVLSRAGRWVKGLAVSVRGSPLPTSYRVSYEKLRWERRKPQSVINQIYFGKENVLDNKAAREVESTGSEDGFDYVFCVAGDTPRPVAAGLGKPNILREHEMPDGHYRVSTLMQLFDRPNMFAVGRCTNIPVVRCYGSSDVEVRTLFRALTHVVGNENITSVDPASFGIDVARMRPPRLHVRMGGDSAVGSTPWAGGMVGTSAFVEFMQDRNYLMKEYQQPMFFRPQDPIKVAQKIRNWLNHEVTDVIAFSHA